jgi:hypothetical protein
MMPSYFTEKNAKSAKKSSETKMNVTTAARGSEKREGEVGNFSLMATWILLVL